MHLTLGIFFVETGVFPGFHANCPCFHLCFLRRSQKRRLFSNQKNTWTIFT